MSLFAAVEMAPRDPILGLNEQFAADTRPEQGRTSGSASTSTTHGKLPLLECVRAGRAASCAAAARPRGYLPIDGIAA
jgi:aromatic-amino-acid transaminase